MQRSHEYWMTKALAEAKKGEKKGEVPIGCLIVHGDRIIARAHNLRETKQDPVAHAELLAIRKAAARQGSWRLLGCTLYVTLEPCLMCAGAIILARVPAVVFGCHDPKGGATGSLYDLSSDSRLNHNFQLTGGVLAEECSAMLSSFFADLRRKRKTGNQAG